MGTFKITSGIPLTTLSEILNGYVPTILLTVAPHHDGMLTNEQAVSLISIAKMVNPSRVLEIGTFMGHTTRKLAENLTDSVIHTVDLPIGYYPDERMSDVHLINGRVVGREFEDTQFLSRIRQHFSDTKTWDFDIGCHPSFFFIDGSHSYDYCKNDSDKCWSIADVPSIFIWHDCDDDHPGVVKLLSEWVEMGREVKRIDGTPLAVLMTK